MSCARASLFAPKVMVIAPDGSACTCMQQLHKHLAAGEGRGAGGGGGVYLGGGVAEVCGT